MIVELTATQSDAAFSLGGVSDPTLTGPPVTFVQLAISAVLTTDPFNAC
jgi:hypothetical protein